MSTPKTPKKGPAARRVPTVKVKDTPTLQEFLGDVVYMQRKYVGKGPHKRGGLANLRYTAILSSSDHALAGVSAVGRKPMEAIAAAFKKAKAAWPKVKEAKLMILVHMKGCSYVNSIPCAIGETLAKAFYDFTKVRIEYSC